MLQFKCNLLSKSLIGVVTWAFLFTLVCAPLTNSRAQEKCDTALADAQKQYNEGRLDDVIKTLENCLPKGIKEADRGQAYRLLSLTYIAKNYLAQAKGAIQKLLEVMPNYQADPDQDPPPFIRTLEEVRIQMAEQQKQKPVEKPKVKPTEIVKPGEEPVMTPTESRKRGSKKFLWIGIGAAALGGGLLAALVGGGGGGNGPPTIVPPDILPDPPGGPGGN